MIAAITPVADGLVACVEAIGIAIIGVLGLCVALLFAGQVLARHDLRETSGEVRVVLGRGLREPAAPHDELRRAT
jgi:UPF0716 family protein affecting phage T7 exclusion